jgi:hypothetical protein
MDVDTARAHAIEAIAQIERDGEPLTLIAEDTPKEYEWCWLFPFNTVRGIETGDIMDSLVTGPLVVPKNGAEPWIAPSSPPVEMWLNEYAEAEGLPLVPVPAMPNPFA